MAKISSDRATPMSSSLALLQPVSSMICRDGALTSRRLGCLRTIGSRREVKMREAVRLAENRPRASMPGSLQPGLPPTEVPLGIHRAIVDNQTVHLFHLKYRRQRLRNPFEDIDFCWQLPTPQQSRPPAHTCFEGDRSQGRSLGLSFRPAADISWPVRKRRAAKSSTAARPLARGGVSLKNTQSSCAESLRIYARHFSTRRPSAL